MSGNKKANRRQGTTESPRYFKYLGYDLSDLAPGATPERIRDLCAAILPGLRDTHIEGPVELVGGGTEYTFVPNDGLLRPPGRKVKTAATSSKSARLTRKTISEALPAKQEILERLMQSADDRMRVMGYSDVILDIIDHAEEFTRGDLQGAVEAAVMKIMRNEKERA